MEQPAGGIFRFSRRKDAWYAFYRTPDGEIECATGQTRAHARAEAEGEIRLLPEWVAYRAHREREDAVMKVIEAAARLDKATAALIKAQTALDLRRKAYVA